MESSPASEKARRLTDEALSDAGLEDPRPAYRRLMVHLKSADASAFEEATRRFNETLVPDVADGRVPPLEAWLAYASWLCDRIRPGKIIAVDDSGRASDGPAALSAGTVLLHLPDDASAPAIVVGMPSEPTASQQVTVELLAR